MGIDVQKQRFRNRMDVFDDLKATGFWPTTLVSGPSPGREVHWHSHDVHAYVMDGRTSILDAESGENHAVGAGDKIVVPARTLHAEGEVRDRVVYVIAAPDPLPFDEFLTPHDPAELETNERQR